MAEKCDQNSERKQSDHSRIYWFNRVFKQTTDGWSLTTVLRVLRVARDRNWTFCKYRREYTSFQSRSVSIPPDSDTPPNLTRQPIICVDDFSLKLISSRRSRRSRYVIHLYDILPITFPYAVSVDFERCVCKVSRSVRFSWTVSISCFTLTLFCAVLVSLHPSACVMCNKLWFITYEMSFSSTA